MQPTRGNLRGFAICVAVAVAVNALTLQVGGPLGSLASAACLGIGLFLHGHPRALEGQWQEGANLAKKHLLRMAVVVLGLAMPLRELVGAGWLTLAVDLSMTLSTLGLAVVLGKRLGMPASLASLVGVGAAVCGTSAVLLTQQATGAKSADAAVAVATVVGSGLCALMLYPALWIACAQIGLLDAVSFARFVGSSVHEVAQVVAIASDLSGQAGNLALATKMGRVLLLAPLLVLLASVARAGLPDPAAVEPETPAVARAAIQGALVLPSLFLASVAVGAVAEMPVEWVRNARILATTLVGAALCGTGLCTGVESISKAGGKPLLLGSALFLWLVVGGLAINALCSFLWT